MNSQTCRLSGFWTSLANLANSTHPIKRVVSVILHHNYVILKTTHIGMNKPTVALNQATYTMNIIYVNVSFRLRLILRQNRPTQKSSFGSGLLTPTKFDLDSDTTTSIFMKWSISF